MNKFKLTSVALLCTVALLTGCAKESDIASQNMSQAADNFQIERKISFYNGVTGKYLLVIEGKCSFNATDAKKVDVICKVSDTEYKKHSLGLSDNVTYFSEQVDAKKVSGYHYNVDYRPESLLRTVSVSTSLGE